MPRVKHSVAYIVKQQKNEMKIAQIVAQSLWYVLKKIDSNTQDKDFQV